MAEDHYAFWTSPIIFTDDLFRGHPAVDKMSSLLDRAPSVIPSHYRPSILPVVTPITVGSACSLLTVSEQKKSGLILCKEFHAEFAGPGAALSSPVEQPYKAVIAIGSPEIRSVTSEGDRARAYGLRIQWGRWLYKIADNPDPSDRVEKLLAGFEGFFGRSVVMSIPDEVLSLLVGVLPQTVQQVKQHYGDTSKTLLFPCQELQVTTLRWDAPSLLMRKDAPLQTQVTMQEIQQTYSYMLRSA